MKVGEEQAVSVGELILVNVDVREAVRRAVALSVEVTVLVRLAVEVWVAVSVGEWVS